MMNVTEVLSNLQLPAITYSEVFVLRRLKTKWAVRHAETL